MTPEATRLFQKAARSLDEARHASQGGFYEAAGRAAYIAALNGAQALIFERTGKASRTHRGVQLNLYRMLDESGADQTMQSFLSTAYNFKAVADYDSGDDATVSQAQADGAIAEARRLLEYIRRLVEP